MYLRAIMYKHMNVTTQTYLSSMSGSNLAISYLIRTLSSRVTNQNRVVSNLNEIQEMFSLWVLTSWLIYSF